MARLKFIIQSKQQIKKQKTIGIIENSSDSIEVIRNRFIGKSYFIPNLKFDGIIQKVDGYKANSDFDRNNIFITVEQESFNKLKIGDAIEIVI